MDPHIRAGLLVNFEPTVTSLGGDVGEVLSLAQLPRDVLANPDHFISYRDYLRLLNVAVTCTGCPHFGLVMSRELGAANLGVTGFVMTQAPSVGEAWASLQRFYHVHDTYGTVLLTENAVQACVRYEIPLSGLPGERQSLDVAAGVAMNIHRLLCGEAVEISTMQFPYLQPADLEPYEFLGCRRLLFDQPGFAMLFPGEVLQLEVAHSEPQMKIALDTYLESLDLSSHHATSREVEKLIRGFLSTGECTLSRVAKFMSMSVRSLQNHLEAEHTSFQLLLDQVRRELSIKHLSEGRVQLTQLAYILGYSELSAFSRSFKRWYGTSPRNWQRLQNATSHSPLDQ